MTQSGTVSRFAIVGVGVAGVYVLLYLVFQKIGATRLPANMMAFTVAIAVQYIGQTRFTYRQRLADLPQITRFGVMIVGGFVTSAVITGLIGPRLGLADVLSAVVVTLVLPVQNFVLMTFWVFSSHYRCREDAL